MQTDLRMNLRIMNDALRCQKALARRPESGHPPVPSYSFLHPRRMFKESTPSASRDTCTDRLTAVDRFQDSLVTFCKIVSQDPLNTTHPWFSERFS